jgi:hypothetical protein
MTLIDIRKVEDSAEAAEFEFSSPDAVQGSIGRLRLEKTAGAISLLCAISAPRPDDRFPGWHTPDALFRRAAHKVWLAWKEGSLPNTLTWAG